MGWFGDYENSQEVFEELEWDLKEYTILNTKVKKTYGAVLFTNKQGKTQIYYYIFRDKQYKPLPYEDAGNRIPKKWIKQVSTN